LRTSVCFPPAPETFSPRFSPPPRRPARHVRQWRQVFQRFSEAGRPRVSRPHRRQRSPIAHEPSRQRRTGPTPSAASGGRPQVVSLLNLQPTPGQRPSRPSIATSHSPRSPSHNIPQHPYPYLGHPAFPSFAHVEAMRFLQYAPQAQGTRPPRTNAHTPYLPSISTLGVPIPILSPLGAPGYHYPPPPVLYNSTPPFPPFSFSTPVSPYIHPQRASDWASIPFQRPPTTSQRSDSSVSGSQVSSTPISSVSPVHTQPPESLTPPPPPPLTAAANGNMAVVDQQQRRLFSSAAPAPIRLLDIPARPCSAPAVFPDTNTAPHDARSRPLVPVTQYLEPTELRGQLAPDLPNSRTSGRRHKQ
jgi:hypothetical protein